MQAAVEVLHRSKFQDPSRLMASSKANHALSPACRPELAEERGERPDDPSFARKACILNGEIMRRSRTDVVAIFSKDTIVRPVGALLPEQNDGWAVERRYRSVGTLSE
jgi:hypothetical protein